MDLLHGLSVECVSVLLSPYCARRTAVPTRFMPWRNILRGESRRRVLKRCEFRSVLFAQLRFGVAQVIGGRENECGLLDIDAHHALHDVGIAFPSGKRDEKGSEFRGTS